MRRAPVRWHARIIALWILSVCIATPFAPACAEEAKDLLPFTSADPFGIEPSLAWNTFLGDSGHQQMWGTTVDANGNIYVAGVSDASLGTPIQPYTAGWDAFVAKFDSDGTLLWTTFLGGSGYDYAESITVDANGNVYVAGGSNASWGTPVMPYTAGWDPFVAKLAGDGTLMWNTFLGGSVDEGGRAIALSSSGDIYVGGYSEAAWGTPLRAFTANDDAFVAKLAGDGTLTWNTFLGGSGTDDIYSIAVDAKGNVYVTGGSDAPWGKPVRAYTSGDDAFVARLTADGTLSWNTFLGGSGSDYGLGIAVDSMGSVYVAGTSYAAWGKPVVAYTDLGDAFVARLKPNGTLSWNTFLGGSGSDNGNGIAVDLSGSVYVTGGSDATWGAPVRGFTAVQDAFAARLKPNGALTWNTFLGDSGNDCGYGIAVDSHWGVCVAGVSWATWGSPIQAYTAESDAFVAKIADANACSYTIRREGKSFGYKQGKVTVAVKASGAAYCATPTVSASDPWISASLVSFKKNKGKVRIAVPPNDSITGRTGTVSIGDDTFRVTQKGAPASQAISPSSSAGGSFSVIAPRVAADQAASAP